ncbi:ATP12 family protein [Tardiphaga sp.]|uniref:ATP12 family chaperone protein n=1 Tax=Tardiphaga sp. TaxID=1926292 RepID=UPI002624CB95|nr:ATP12 family protein [Tardiphaga sp.]MDB5619558.1 ATPase [Tardiphaga sp.]
MRELFDEVYGQAGLDPEEAVRKSTRGPQRKRFYTQAGMAETPEGFAITLDGKTVRTPSRQPLALPERSIAEAIVAEWQAQQDTINPTTMPLTRLANSVIDAVGDNVQGVTEDIVKYFGTDLLFYRAGHPKELVAREAESWDPVLFWAAEDFGAHFILAEGIIHVQQPATAIAAARATLPQDSWIVAALHLVTTITGSALLAVALLRGRLDADQVWAAAHVDEDWNIEHWGVDEEVAHRRAAKQVDFRAAASVVQALAPRSG